MPQALHCHGNGDPQSPQYLLWSATVGPAARADHATLLVRMAGEPFASRGPGCSNEIARSQDGATTYARSRRFRWARIRSTASSPLSFQSVIGHCPPAQVLSTGLIYGAFACILLVVQRAVLAGGNEIMSATVKRMVRDLDVMKKNANTVAKRLNIRKKRQRSARRKKGADRDYPALWRAERSR